MTIAGPLIGVCFAVVGTMWIMAGKNNAVEVTVFFCVSYLAFIVAEQEAGSSGVLSVVVGGVLVGAMALPYVDDPHAMHNVWHWIEFVGNTLVFTLAGCILGIRLYEQDNITAQDWGFVLLNWMAVNVVRFLVIALFFPALKRMGYGLTFQEAVFMGWGGLRGAVGLALAISVASSPEFAGADGERYLFHVGGVAALTLLVNGTTGAALLTKLGLLDVTAAQAQALKEARHKVALAAKSRYEKLAAMPMFANHRESKGTDIVAAIERTVMPEGMEMQNEDGAAAKIQDVAIGLEGDEKSENAEVDVNEFVPVLRVAFLNSLKQEYWHLVHHGEVPQENANVLLHSTSAAMDTVTTHLSEWDTLRARFECSRMEALLGGIIAPKMQLTLCLAFIEAHERTMKTVFDVFGEGEGADSVEELILEREAKEILAAVHHYIDFVLDLKHHEIADATTDLMFLALKTQMRSIASEMADKGVITPIQAAEIAADVKKGMEKSAPSMPGRLSRVASSAKCSSEDLTTLADGRQRSLSISRVVAALAPLPRKDSAQDMTALENGRGSLDIHVSDRE